MNELDINTIETVVCGHFRCHKQLVLAKNLGGGTSSAFEVPADATNGKYRLLIGADGATYYELVSQAKRFGKKNLYVRHSH